MEEIRKDLASLKSDFWELKASVAAQKPVDEIVKYLLYFWLTISIILGIFGWKQLSDLDEQIKRAVASQFPEDSNNYKNYKTLISNTNILYSDFEDLTKSYKERVDDLRYADIVASDFDIEGQIQTIVLESNNPGNILDSEWRTKAITVLQKLKSALREKVFPATFVFNAAQVCRQLQQFQLAEDMTNAAYEKDPSPSIRALKLASEVSTKTGKEREAAYLDLVGMVETLDYESSPQIVLAEAWNAAETYRRYQPLIESLSKLLSSEGAEQIPSYAYLIKAQAMLRLGNASAKEEALSTAEKGYEIYKKESSLSQWNDSFRREYPQVIAVIQEDMAIDPESDGDITQQMELLKQLLSPSLEQFEEGGSTNKQIQPTQ